MEKCFTKLSPSSGVTSALFKVTFPHIRQTRFLSVRTHARLLFLLDTLFSIDVFICPCVHAVFLSLSPLPFHRASEQKHINVTAVHLNGSSPRQLDLDLYLGVYAGDARRAHIAFFFFCVPFVAVNAAAIQ